MELVEGGTRAEVASTLDLAQRSTGLAPASGVEPRARFVKCLDSSLCYAVSPQEDVGLIITISNISTSSS